MNYDKNAFKAGLFIVAAIGLCVAILVAIKGTGAFFDPMQNLTAEFELTENVGGLTIGDAVRVGGVNQGRVTDVRFVASDANGASHRYHIDFALPARFDIRRDAIVQVEQGLTGTSNLNISAFGTGLAAKPGDVLDGQGATLARILDRAPQVVDTLNDTLAEARGAIGDIRQQVGPVVKRYDSTMERADQTLTHARDIFGDTKTDIRTTIGNLSTATGTLKERLPVTFEKVDQFLTKTTATIESASGTLADIRVSAANAKDVTAEVKSILIRNRSKIDNMLTGLRDTSSNLENASAEIRRSPWRLLYQPKADELSNLNIYDSAREFSEAATRLNDAATAVRDAAKDPTLSPERMKELLDSLDASFEKYRSVESKLWTAVK